jgi:acetolactate synthase I/II/III large subunit
MDRRSFLKDAAGALAGGAAFGSAAQSEPAQHRQEAETESLTTDRCGADCMVDVVKAVGLEYICANPGSSFRALHESIVNYGGNARPELITCCHEESSVAMAHGFGKIEGRPIGVMTHGTVCLQHARWRSTTPTAIASRSTSSSATRSTRRSAVPAAPRSPTRSTAV